ncbi:MAG: Gfo/Idh/MocA family oxidoreductase [Alkalibacterium sp.]|nr:Gfo/Idh/MocA family oxidoreductase [Alkalibacterium sp.]
MEKIRWGIIGSKETAHSFASAFESDRSQLAGIASPTLQQAFDFAVQYSIKKAYGTYEELAYDPEIDIIYITGSGNPLYKNILMVLKAGKHVLCETFSSLSAGQLQQISVLAEDNNLLVAETEAISPKQTANTLSFVIDEINQMLASETEANFLLMIQDVSGLAGRAVKDRPTNDSADQ